MIRLETPDVERPAPRLEEKFLQTRTILVYGEINQKLSQIVTEQLLLLSAESNEPIKVIINSQGGQADSGFMIYDMLRFVTAPVKTIGAGLVASAGALIFVAPPAEQRLSLPNTRFMIHQPIGGIGGSVQDMTIEAKEIIKLKQRLNEIFAGQTGQPYEKIERDTDRNFWMGAEEAKEYGLVGQIVASISDV